MNSRSNGRGIATRDTAAMLEAGAELEALDLNGAMELYRAAAEMGDVDAMQKVMVRVAGTNPDESRRWQDRLVATGASRQMILAAQNLQDRYPARAAELYRAAMDAGDSSARAYLEAMRARLGGSSEADSNRSEGSETDGAAG